MLKMQSHYIAEKAEQLIEEGQYTLAIRLLLSVLPEKVDKPDRPYVAAAELALRKGDQFHSSNRFISNHDNGGDFAQFSPDGNYIVTTSDDYTAKIWDTKTGQQVGETMEHEDDVLSAQFSPDGNYIMTASDDKSIRIWDIKLPRKTMKHEDCVRSALFSPDGNYIVTASNDSTAKIWDAKTGKQVGETMKHEGHVRSALFSPDGNYIVTASMQLKYGMQRRESKWEKL